MMNVAASDTISVWPSGGAFATYSPPMICVAPGRFSTTTGWPHTSASRLAMERESASVAPPGAAGTTILTGREGNGWASAGNDRASAQARAKNVRVTELLRQHATLVRGESLC